MRCSSPRYRGLGVNKAIASSRLGYVRSSLAAFGHISVTALGGILCSLISATT